MPGLLCWKGEHLNDLDVILHIIDIDTLLLECHTLLLLLSHLGSVESGLLLLADDLVTKGIELVLFIFFLLDLGLTLTFNPCESVSIESTVKSSY